MTSAMVLIVGDEILQGHTQDTNSHYLATRLGARDVELRRIVSVGDDVDVIASALEDLLRHGPDFIFVCGGIGPTPDDRTYEAVAIATGLPLVLHPDDEAWMRRRVAGGHYGAGLLEDEVRAEALWRMVRRPEKSLVLDNPVGAALGSAVATGRSLVFVLPGVPRELRAMMEQVVEPRFIKPAADARSVGELEVVGEEARFWPILRELEALFPMVRIGSYPQDEKGRIIMRVQGPPAMVQQVLDRLQSAAPGPARRIR